MKSGLFNVSSPDSQNYLHAKCQNLCSVEVVASNFFQFIQGFNVEEGYMNTYTGDIGLKIESEDIIDNSGLTVLHPYYSNITLLPFK